MCTEETGKNFNKFCVLYGFLHEQRIVMTSSMKAGHPPEARFSGEFGNPQEHEVREHRKRFQH